MRSVWAASVTVPLLLPVPANEATVLLASNSSPTPAVSASVTALLSSAWALFNCSLPPVTLVAPLTVLAPVSVTVPPVDLFSATAPASTALTVPACRS